MPASVSPRIARSQPMVIGDTFRADHFNEGQWRDGAMSPIVMVDHFWMYARTFDEHPHAGISAVTLMLPDSPGAMRSIDSLGHLSEFRAGDLHWTVAGTGVTHNQFPVDDRAIHALQIFVNLPAARKDITPDSFEVAAADMPVIERDGMRMRVVAGEVAGLASPAALPQPLLFLDVTAGSATPAASMPVPEGWSVTAIVISGSIDIWTGDVAGSADPTRVDAGTAAAFAAVADLHLAFPEPGQVVLLAGVADPSPVYTNGPFVYDSVGALRQAEIRYSRGEFGHCPPMPPPGAAWVTPH